MEDFSTRLKRLRKLKGLTQEALAEQLGVRKTTISNYESGYSTPTFATLGRLAQVLGVSIDSITTKPSVVYESDAARVEVPLCVPGSDGAPETVAIPRALLGEGDFFFYELADDSMEGAGLRKGDWALCRRRDAAKDGMLAVVSIGGAAQAIRYYSERDGKIALIASGRDFPSIYDSSEVAVLGEVVRVVSSPGK